MGSTKSVGKVLKIARYANNISVKAASSASGVSAIYIRELEVQKKSNVSEEILQKLAKVYNLYNSQIMELEAYYSSLDVEEERKFRLTLIKTLEMMESNYSDQPADR